MRKNQIASKGQVKLSKEIGIWPKIVKKTLNSVLSSNLCSFLRISTSLRWVGTLLKNPRTEVWLARRHYLIRMLFILRGNIFLEEILRVISGRTSMTLSPTMDKSWPTTEISEATISTSRMRFGSRERISSQETQDTRVKELISEEGAVIV